MITLAEFTAKYTGQTVSFIGCPTDSCMAVPHQYLTECFGLTDPLLLAEPTAAQVWTNFTNNPASQYFTPIANTPTGFPSAGDIIIFAPNNPHSGTTEAGHIAVVVTADVNQFTCFEQDYPFGSTAHVGTHIFAPDGKDILGWLTAKEQGKFLSDAEYENMVQQTIAYEQLITSGFSTADDVNQKLQSYTTQISDLQNQVGKLTSSNEALQLEVQSNKDQMAKLADITQQQATSDSSAIDQGLTAGNQVKELTSDLVSIASNLDTTYPPVKNITGAITTLQTQLKAAQIALTKQAEINKALKESQERTQAVVNTTKGFFSQAFQWLKNQVWVSK